MTAANPALERQETAAELAQALPPYDPLERRPQTRSRVVMLLSLLLHLALLAFFWDTLIGAIIEEEEIVEVRMMEQEPEPKKPPEKSPPAQPREQEEDAPKAPPAPPGSGLG